MRCRGGRRGKGREIGLVIAAFGIGLIVALCCPKGVIIAILAAALIVLGITLYK